MQLIATCMRGGPCHGDSQLHGTIDGDADYSRRKIHEVVAASHRTRVHRQLPEGVPSMHCIILCVLSRRRSSMKVCEGSCVQDDLLIHISCADYMQRRRLCRPFLSWQNRRTNKSSELICPVWRFSFLHYFCDDDLIF
jgi:hypothetical protein